MFSGDLSPKVGRQGWIYKRGGGGTSSAYRRRYAILRGNQLFYYRRPPAQQAVSPQGVVRVLSASIAPEDMPGKAAFTMATDSGRTFYVCVETAEERAAWLAVLPEAPLARGASSLCLSDCHAHYGLTCENPRLRLRLVTSRRLRLAPPGPTRPAGPRVLVCYMCASSVVRRACHRWAVQWSVHRQQTWPPAHGKQKDARAVFTKEQQLNSSISTAAIKRWTTNH